MLEIPKLIIVVNETFNNVNRDVNDVGQLQNLQKLGK